MASKIFELIGEIGMNTVRLQADVGKATRIMSTGMKQMTQAVSFLKNSLLGLASVGSLVAIGKSAIDLGGKLSDMSKKFGVSAEELSKLMYVGKMVGVELEDIGNGFKFLSKAISESQDPASQAATAFRLLGVTTKNANGTVKDSNQVFDELADAFAGLEDGANKTALALAIFGRAGANMLPMFEKGAAGIKDMKAEAVAMGLALGDDEIKKLDEYGDAIDRIGMKAKTSAGRLAIFFAEMMTKASGAMEGVPGFVLDTGPAESNVGEDVGAGGAYKRPAASIAAEEARKKASEKAAEERKKADEALLKAGEKGWVDYAAAIVSIYEEEARTLSGITKTRLDEEEKENKESAERTAEYWGASAQAIVDADFEAALAKSDFTKKVFEDAAKANEAIKDFVVNGFNEMADSVADFVTTGKLDFKDFVNSAIGDLTRLVVKMQMFKMLEGFGLGSWLGIPVTPKATGGPVFGGAPYLVGERGPELFVPSSSGNIVPNGGSQSVKVQVINESGTPMQVRDSKASFDAQEMVVTLWMDAAARNRFGLRSMLGGA